MVISTVVWHGAGSLLPFSEALFRAMDTRAEVPRVFPHILVRMGENPVGAPVVRLRRAPQGSRKWTQSGWYIAIDAVVEATHDYARASFEPRPGERSRLIHICTALADAPCADRRHPAVHVRSAALLPALAEIDLEREMLRTFWSNGLIAAWRCGARMGAGVRGCVSGLVSCCC